MKQSRWWLLMIALCTLTVVGCENSTNDPLGKGQLRLYLTDAPASYDSVVVAVKEVSVHSESEGWIAVNQTPRMFDLLLLSNGATAVLGEATLEPGLYTQIRLLLDVGSYVVVNGTRYPLTIPSGVETGIKLVHQFQLEPNFLYELYLDFDASRSVILTGSGEYKLKPTIRVVAAATTGTISGIVIPATHHALITAMSETDTASTFSDIVTGAFLLTTVPGGDYYVTIQSTTAVRETTFTGVHVSTGSNTSLGTIMW